MVFLRDLIALMRPAQWTKNAFVLAPLIFSGRLFDPAAFANSMLAVAVFCAVAGVVAVGASMSVWLLGCTFLLATFLALAKRRHEAVLMAATAGDHRQVLAVYGERWLDHLVRAAAMATVVVYILYALSPSVADKLGTTHLWVTIPFVVFGVFRYLFLVYGRNDGGNPTDVLLGDLPLQAGIVSWLLAVFFLLYR